MKRSHRTAILLNHAPTWGFDALLVSHLGHRRTLGLVCFADKEIVRDAPIEGEEAEDKGTASVQARDETPYALVQTWGERLCPSQKGLEAHYTGSIAHDVAKRGGEQQTAGFVLLFGR
jgi:hypothetical protein